MGMQYSICRIPSSVPQGGVECAFDPSPTQFSIGEPWGASHGSQLPLETHSFIMHDLTLWVPNAIDHQTICRRWFGFFSDIFPCLCSRLKSGWSSMVALQKKKEKKNLGLLPETVGIIFVSKNFFFYEYAPPSHYALFGGGGGIGEQVGKLFILNYKLGGFLNQKIRWYFCLRKDGFYCYTLRNRSRFRMRHLKNFYWFFFGLEEIIVCKFYSSWLNC